MKQPASKKLDSILEADSLRAMLQEALEELGVVQRERADHETLGHRLEAEEKEAMGNVDFGNSEGLGSLRDIRMQREALPVKIERLDGSLRQAGERIARIGYDLQAAMSARLDEVEAHHHHELWQALRPFFSNRSGEIGEAVRSIANRTNCGLEIQRLRFEIKSADLAKSFLGAPRLVRCFEPLFNVQSQMVPATMEKPRVKTCEEIERAELAALLEDREPAILAKMYLRRVVPGEGSQPFFNREQASEIVERRLVHLLSCHPDAAPREFARYELRRLEPTREAFIVAQVEDAVSSAKQKRLNSLSREEEFAIASNARKRAEAKFDERLAALRKQLKEEAA